MQKKKGFIVRLMSLAVIVMLLAAGAVLRDGKLFGSDLRAADGSAAPRQQYGDTLSVNPDGSVIVNTKPLANDVEGYGGPVPLRIHLSKDGVVEEIEALPNAETPDFFDSAKTLLQKWQGKTLDAALAEKVDGVSELHSPLRQS